MSAINQYRAILAHYLELLRSRSRLVAAAVFLTMLLTAGASVALLHLGPRYTAEAVVTMLPSESELTFTRNWLGRSQIDPVTISTTTYLEHLYSRPVLEDTLDRVLASYVPPPPAGGWRGRLRGAYQATVGRLRGLYEFANYGHVAPTSERDQQLAMLRSGIEVVPMQASYILRISATLGDPRLAALAANALAEGYVARALEDGEQTAEALGQFISSEIANREARLGRLELEATRLDRDVAVAGDSAAAIIGLRAEEASLAARRAALEALAEDDPSRAALRAQITRQEEGVAATRSHLVEAGEKREALAEVRRKIAALTTDLDDLRQKLLSVDLSSTEAVAQVRIVEPAVPPTTPASPQVLNNTIISGVVAFLLCGMIIVARDVFGERVGSTAQLERLVGERAIGRLPRRLRSSAQPSPAMTALARRLTTAAEELAPLAAHKEVRVTALGPGSPPDEAAAALALALTSIGTPAEAVSAGSSARSPEPGTIAVVPWAEPIGEFWAFGSEAVPALLALVPRDRVAEGEIFRFERRARSRGITAVWFAIA
jgi:polysaccharide biosynthesis transport protein